MIAAIALSYDDARSAVETAVAELSRRGKAAVVAVADSHGDLLAFARMDGAPLSSITIAMNKAWTAARTGGPTLDIFLRAKTDPGFDIAYYGDARYCGWGGGVPLRKDGQVVGSIAVSALTMEEDAEIAALAAAAVMPG
jgi:glc operon protein GlcG